MKVEKIGNFTRILLHKFFFVNVHMKAEFVGSASNRERGNFQMFDLEIKIPIKDVDVLAKVRPPKAPRQLANSCQEMTFLDIPVEAIANSVFGLTLKIKTQAKDNASKFIRYGVITKQ